MSLKKMICAVFLGIITLVFAACGGGQYSIDDLIGKWVSVDSGQIMTISANEVDLFHYEGSIVGSKEINPAKIKGNQVDLSSLSKYTIEKDGETLKMTCDETNTVQKGTVFVKTKDVYSEKDLYVDWVNQSSGDTLTHSGNSFKLERKDGSSDTFPDESFAFAGEYAFIRNVGKFNIKEEDETLKLEDGDNVFIRKDDLVKIAKANREKYKDVYDILSKNVWVFNGGSNTVISFMKFAEEDMTFGQYSFDGNGIHEGNKFSGQYTIEDSQISISFSDGSNSTVPYSYTDGTLVLDNKKYLTLAEVQSGLQGFWKGKSGNSEQNIQIDGSTIRLESASQALFGDPGDYYYYGPYEGQFTLGIGCFDTSMMHGGDIYFNIIDGKPTILYYDTVCSPSEGFPGEDGYSF